MPKLIAASAALGIALSLAVALLGPLIEPIPHDRGRNVWCTRCVAHTWTQYRDESAPHASTPDLVLQRLMRASYFPGAPSPILLGFATISNGRSMTLLQTGWPCRSLEGWAAVQQTMATGPLAPAPSGLPDLSGLPPPKAVIAAQITNQLEASSGVLMLGPSDSIRMVYSPRWPALLANAAAFTLPLIALSLLPRMLDAKRRRLTKAQCPRCGYDRRGLHPASSCPECGNSSSTTTPTHQPAA